MFKPSENGSTRGRRRAAATPVALHDKQSERDHRQLRIDKVGVRGMRFPIQVRDKAPVTAAITTDLIIGKPTSHDLTPFSPARFD